MLASMFSFRQHYTFSVFSAFLDFAETHLPLPVTM